MDAWGLLFIGGREHRMMEIAYDKPIDKERNVVERFCARAKAFRRIATRYDKIAIVYNGEHHHCFDFNLD